jgi:antitoxin FitA
MATLAIRNLDQAIKERLRVQAARNGRSMEAELRAILTEAVGAECNRETTWPRLSAAASRRWAASSWTSRRASPRANHLLSTDVRPRH